MIIFRNANRTINMYGKRKKHEHVFSGNTSKVLNISKKYIAEDNFERCPFNFTLALSLLTGPSIATASEEIVAEIGTRSAWQCVLSPRVVLDTGTHVSDIRAPETLRRFCLNEKCVTFKRILKNDIIM